MALRTSAAGYPGPHLGATLAECLWHLCHSSGLWSIALVEVSRNAQRSSPTLWLHGDYERRPAKSFLGSAWLVWLGSYTHQSQLQLHWSYGNTRRLKNIHSRTRSEWSNAQSKWNVENDRASYAKSRPSSSCRQSKRPGHAVAFKPSTSETSIEETTLSTLFPAAIQTKLLCDQVRNH